MLVEYAAFDPSMVLVGVFCGAIVMNVVYNYMTVNNDNHRPVRHEAIARNEGNIQANAQPENQAIGRNDIREQANMQPQQRDIDRNVMRDDANIRPRHRDPFHFRGGERCQGNDRPRLQCRNRLGIELQENYRGNGVRLGDNLFRDAIDNLRHIPIRRPFIDFIFDLVRDWYALFHYPNYVISGAIVATLVFILLALFGLIYWTVFVFPVRVWNWTREIGQRLRRLIIIIRRPDRRIQMAVLVQEWIWNLYHSRSIGLTLSDRVEIYRVRGREIIITIQNLF